jgi:hypothetical protein
MESVLASNTLLSFAVRSLLCGVFDFTLIFQVMINVPNGKWMQDTGADTYWFDKDA